MSKGRLRNMLSLCFLSGLELALLNQWFIWEGTSRDTSRGWGIKMTGWVSRRRAGGVVWIQKLYRGGGRGDSGVRGPEGRGKDG